MSDNYSRISQNIFWSKRSLYIFLDLNPFNTPIYLILHSDTKPTLFLQNSIVRFQMCHVCQKCAFVLSSTAQQEECSNVLQCPKSNYSSQFVKFFTWDKELYRKWKIATSTDFSKQTLFSEKELFRFMLKQFLFYSNQNSEKWLHSFKQSGFFTFSCYFYSFWNSLS